MKSYLLKLLDTYLILLAFITSVSANLIDNGGGFIYDDDYDITWTANAKMTEPMTWDEANAWAASLDLGGVKGWRLPTTVESDVTASEMGHLFYYEYSDLSLLTNIQYTGPHYWSSTESTANSDDAWLFRFADGVQVARPKFTTRYAWAVHDGNIGPIPIIISIDIAGGQIQECSAINGSFVSLTSDVQLLDGSELSLVTWVIDGENAGTGNSIEPFLKLGEHSIIATAESTSGYSSNASTHVVVTDTTAPDITVNFIDEQSGEPIISIDHQNAHHVTTQMVASDICDPNPEILGTGGVDIVNGSVLKVKGNDNSVTLTTNSILLRATTTDASGNSVNVEKMLTITY